MHGSTTCCIAGLIQSQWEIAIFDPANTSIMKPEI